MFRKLLNVGKGLSTDDKLQQQQQQLQLHQNQQKNLFNLNEIKSYGFSNLSCLGYSASLSLLAVGSKYGLLRILGSPSVEFSYQLESGNSIRQIEFVDCRKESKLPERNNKSTKKQQANQEKQQELENGHNPEANNHTTGPDSGIDTAKIIVLTDNGQLHLFELRNFKQQFFADSTTQTEQQEPECCPPQHITKQDSLQPQEASYTKLLYVARLDYFRFRPEDEDRSRRVTTIEVSADGQLVFVGTEGSNVYIVPLVKFESLDQQSSKQQVSLELDGGASTIEAHSSANKSLGDDLEESTAVNLNDEPQITSETVEPFELIKFDEMIASQLTEETIKAKKQGAVESIKKHPRAYQSAGQTHELSNRLLISYHRGLSVLYDFKTKTLDKFFYHNQVLESSCFSSDLNGDFFYTSHSDGSYIKWDIRQGSQSKANEDFLSQLYGPYPCKPTPKIQACSALLNDQLENVLIFSGGMPRATYDDKNPVTIVRSETDGKDKIRTVLDLTSKVLDFALITRPRGQLGAGAKLSATGTGNNHSGAGGGGKKNKHKRQQQQQQQQQLEQLQRNQPVAVALAVLAEEEFVLIDLLNSDSYLEFALPYLNCIHSSAITCSQHYSDISEELYQQLSGYQKDQVKGTLSQNEWPLKGGRVLDVEEIRQRDLLLTGHEDGSVDFWDVSGLSLRHLMHLKTSHLFATADDDELPPIQGQTTTGDGESTNEEATKDSEDQQDKNDEETSNTWPPLKRVGRFDPFSDDTRLAIRKLSLCPQTGTLIVAGTGGQVMVFELKNKPYEVKGLKANLVTIVDDPRFPWKGRERLQLKQQVARRLKYPPGYQLMDLVQLSPPVAATSLDLRTDWCLFALGTSYGFMLYDYSSNRPIVAKCTLNQADYALVGGDASGAISRKKSFRKSLRESFRRLRRGRSQRNQPAGGTVTTGVTPLEPNSNQSQQSGRPAFSRLTTGVRSLNTATGAAQPLDSDANTMQRIVYPVERQVEPKVELSSIVKCVSLTAAQIGAGPHLRPSFWVGTNAGQVLVYAITLASEQTSTVAAPDQNVDKAEGVAEEVQTSAKLAKEVQLKHRAPIIAIHTSPQEPRAVSHHSDEQPGDGSLRESPEKQASELLQTTASQQDTSAASIEAESRAPGLEPKQQATGKSATGGPQAQARVLICSEEQFKVFNLPNMKPFCKFKLTAHEGLRAKKINITNFPRVQKQVSISSTKKTASGFPLAGSKSLQSFATQTSAPSSPTPNDELPNGNVPSDSKQTGSNENNNNSLSALNNNNLQTTGTSSGSKELMSARFGAKTNVTASASAHQFAGEQNLSSEAKQEALVYEPYMVCMSNQGDCAIYSIPELKRIAQVQVCKREDVNGIQSTMLTDFGEGFYLKSSSTFMRFSISGNRVLRSLSVI